jgi:copper transport protein
VSELARPSGRRRRRKVALCCALVGVVLLAATPPAAQAHAVLEDTSPGQGAHLTRAPHRVVFHFDEPVEIAFGSVRVYDGKGDRVDEGATEHIGGRGDEVGVRLRSGLGESSYSATYRVISADSHPVSGGFVFTVGNATTPARTLDELIDSGGSGPVTETAFGVVRALGYLALALAVGGAAFAAAVWRPVLRASAGATDDWLTAGDAFAGRVRRLVLIAVAIGLLSSALAMLLQGAIASGTSLWRTIDPGVVGDVVGTRFGTVYALRLVAWLAVAGLLLAPVPGLRVPTLRQATLGATGVVVAPPATATSATVLAVLLAFLCLTPALAGHASATDPTWLLIPANFLHVVCMSVWVGGIAMLLGALPAATSRLEPSDRSRLLAASVGRFSTFALGAVAVLVASGVVQAIAELQSLADLTGTAFGRAILIKVALLIGLICLGAWNRQRARPRLAAVAARGDSPGAVGVALRRSLRTELTLMLVVVGVTSALVSYAPSSNASGPFSASETLGPARLELTVDPASTGRNQVHLYLFDRRSGRQFRRVKELTVEAELPSRSIGPLHLRPEPAGPGHYVVRRADIAPPGDWQLEVTARVSAFDEYASKVKVPVR